MSFSAVEQWHPAAQALAAGSFTWIITALGAGVVFVVRAVRQRQLDIMEGFAAGVMIAASYWSLLAPAIEMSQGKTLPAWLPAASGFVLGGLFLAACDRTLPHLHLGAFSERSEGIKTGWHRTVLLTLAVTLHNIPEGLAIGVAFGAAATGAPEASVSGAIALAIGIGLQNFPEGLAISLPMRREGYSRWKSFNAGQASALVEPAAAVVGAYAVILAAPILPYAMSFAAGAMIFVVVEELIPESHRVENHDAASLGALAGFTVMMILDVALR